MSKILLASWHLLYCWAILSLAYQFKGFLSFETGSHCIDLAGFELKRSAWLCLLSVEIKGPHYQLSFDYLFIYMAVLGIEPMPHACRIDTLPKELVYIFYTRLFQKRCVFEQSSRQRNILFNYLVHVNEPLFQIFIHDVFWLTILLFPTSPKEDVL